ncbi:unnamed protein product, partial [Closterium sp. Yama58-4]
MAATSLVDALKSAALRILDSASPAVLASAGLSNHTSDASSSWSAPASLHRATSALWSSAINRTGAGNAGSGRADIDAQSRALLGQLTPIHLPQSPPISIPSPPCLSALSVCAQRYRRPWLDAFMSFMAMAVSVEFYTAFLPVLFWSGRPYLASLAVLLLALCTYAGNALKDVVAAPRPLSPPAQRVTGTHMDAQSSFEFGLPSSHTSTPSHSR